MPHSPLDDSTPDKYHSQESERWQTRGEPLSPKKQVAIGENKNAHYASEF